MAGNGARANAFVRPYEISRAAHPSVIMMTKDKRAAAQRLFLSNNILDPLERDNVRLPALLSSLAHRVRR
jgi:hypothetical protein